MARSSTLSRPLCTLRQSNFFYAELLPSPDNRPAPPDLSRVHQSGGTCSSYWRIRIEKRSLLSTGGMGKRHPCARGCPQRDSLDTVVQSEFRVWQLLRHCTDFLAGNGRIVLRMALRSTFIGLAGFDHIHENCAVLQAGCEGLSLPSVGWVVHPGATIACFQYTF